MSTFDEKRHRLLDAKASTAANIDGRTIQVEQSVCRGGTGRHSGVVRGHQLVVPVVPARPEGRATARRLAIAEHLCGGRPEQLGLKTTPAAHHRVGSESF